MRSWEQEIFYGDHVEIYRGFSKALYGIPLKFMGYELLVIRHSLLRTAHSKPGFDQTERSSSQWDATLRVCATGGESSWPLSLEQSKQKQMCKLLLLISFR